MKRHRAIVAVWIAALCFLVLLVASIWLVREPQWMSDPTIVRPPSVRPSGAPPWSDYAITLGDPRPVPQVVRRLFDSFSVTKDDDAVTVAYPSVAQAAHEIAGYSIHRAGPNQRVEMSGGAITLRHVGVTYEQPPPGMDYQSSWQQAARFFDASNLQLLLGEHLEREIPNDRHRLLQFVGRFPKVQFSFRRERLEEFHFLDLAAYDARTQRNLIVGGYSGNRRNESEFHFDVNLRLWHQTPVEVVLTCAHGPFDVISIEPRLGETIRHARGELKLIAIQEGKRTGGGGRGSGNTNITYVRLSHPPNEQWTTYVFASLSPSRSLPLHFEFFDAEGQRFRGESDAQGEIRSATVALDPQKVARIDAKLYRHFKHLIFRLPEIPGLPSENRGTQNLFDIHIPWIRVRNQDDLWRILMDLLQMEITESKARSLPPQSFPRYYTNVTAADLFREYRKAFPERTVVRVDGERHQIEIKTHPVVELWNRARKFVTGK